MHDDASPQVQQWLDRLNAGDRSAEGLLLAFLHERWRGCAHRALRNSPNRAGAVEDTEGVLSELSLRVLQDWRRGAVPTTATDFYRQTANNFGNALVDLIRKHFSRNGERPLPGPLPPIDPGTETLDPAQLTLWTAFHKEVRELPEHLRAVFELRWYHDLSLTATADLLGIAPRTVSKYYAEACEKLSAKLGGNPFSHADG